jgi:hypothetical protein
MRHAIASRMLHCRKITLRHSRSCVASHENGGSRKIAFVHHQDWL